MIAVVQVLYILDPPAAILVNRFGVEAWGNGEQIWGVPNIRPMSAGRILTSSFLVSKSNNRLRFLGIARGPGTAAGPC